MSRYIVLMLDDTLSANTQYSVQCAHVYKRETATFSSTSLFEIFLTVNVA